MQGSVAIAPSPIIMDSMNFRQNIGTSFARSVLQRSCGSNTYGGTSTARCLFGPPDPKQCKDLVKEVELKISLTFGKRFNFDVINGEPFPSAKKMKFSDVPCSDSDEENVQLVTETENLENLQRVVMKEKDEETGNESYVWTERYAPDYMEMCNKHAVSTSIVGASRHTVSLLFAPIILNNQPLMSSFSSSVKSYPKESPSNVISSSESSSEYSVPTSPSSRLLSVSSSEANNNNINNKNKNKGAMEKRQNRINSLSQHQHHSYPIKARKTSILTAQQILTRVKHAVMKKQRKTIITDYMFMRRMKASAQQSGKKQ